MHPEITDHQQLKDACHPHELFLINLIFNHILLFAAALGAASSSPLFVVPIPVVSAAILTFTLWRARQALVRDPWFVKCHWQVAARRSRLFLGLLSIVVGIVVSIWLLAGGHPRPQHWALLGAVILPTMVTILVLIIMETEAMQQARHGLLPKWVIERFPNPAIESAST
jgi:hypothetical protein